MTRSDLVALATQAAHNAGIDPSLVLAVIQNESGWKPDAVSGAGAGGLMQLMPGTASDMGITPQDRFDPAKAIPAGVGYLKQQLERFGTPQLALAAYNAGPGAVQKAGGIPDIPETRNYVAKNMATMRQDGTRIFGQAGNPPSVGDGASIFGIDPSLPDTARGASNDGSAIFSQFDDTKPYTLTPPTQMASGKDVTYSSPGIDVQLHYDDTPAPTKKSGDASIGTQIGRQIGLTGRAAINGITALPNMLWNGPAGAINALTGTNIPFASPDALSDALGLPKPQGSMENIAQDVISAMTGAGSTAKTAGLLGDIAPGITSRVLGLLGDNVGSQVATAGLGSGASSSAREVGYDPGVQVGAGLLAGTLPMGAMHTVPQIIRNLATGGEDGRQNMLRTIDTFRAVGATPTLGQATQARDPLAIESMLTRAPGGAGIMASKAQSQASEIQNRVGGIVDDLSGNAGAVQAGESVAQGLQNFKQGVKDLQSNLYGNLDQFIPATTPIQTARTQAALHDLNQSIAGAENVSKMFQNSKIAGILGNFEKDLTNSAQQPVQTGFGGIMSAPPPMPLSQATMPYKAVKKLRTLVGQEIDNTNFTSDVPRSKWRALYGALSNDLGDAAANAGPEAQQAWNWANAFTRSQAERLDQLNGIIGKDSPEKIFQSAMAGTNEGDTILKRVVSAIPKDNRRDLAATVIARMGRATPGNQNDVGEIFSPNTFLTNWNRMSPAARQTLFGRVDRPGLLGDLGDVASVASNLRDGSKVFSNPSGTSGAFAGLGMFQGGLTALLTGHPLLAGAAVAPIPVANWLARKMTDPGLLGRFAQPLPPVSYLTPGLLGAAVPQINYGLLGR
jgi:hypothetical protein